MDAVYRAINRVIGEPNELIEFSVQAVTEGIDAVGRVTIRIRADDGGEDTRWVFSGHGADTDIVVASAKAYMFALNRLIADLQTVPVNIRVLPDYFSLAVFRATVEDFGGLPLVNLREPALNPYQRLMKRLLDLALGSLALLLAAPVMALIVLVIKLDSPGPALFRSKRVGENGKLFDMIKFRSMVVDAEKIGAASTSGDDPRVTRSGRFIRKWKLDELSQLFNVLLGDISLTGYPIIGHLYAERAGHAIHTALAEQIARRKTHYEIRTISTLDTTLPKAI